MRAVMLHGGRRILCESIGNLRRALSFEIPSVPMSTVLGPDKNMQPQILTYSLLQEDVLVLLCVLAIAYVRIRSSFTDLA